MMSSSKQDCAICTDMLNNGHAIFIAECSHSFHYHCITSNVQNGNRVCPVCRALWKEIPFQGMPPQQILYDDDEPVNQESEEMHSAKSDSDEGIKIKTYTEIPAVAKSANFDDFGILINLKAPVSKESLNSRTPIDLVTILDISGSMEGSKIALLKKAMGFVVQNLGPLDRLSVISFASSARRLFPLRHMTEIGKQESLQVINSLVANGATNILEALKKGSKVMTDRKFKNPVSSMILLSDGQDTCNHEPLTLPDTRVPIHTFGFGKDHDANLMHSISEKSRGMFSFIEVESVIQDAFAQCIGGLLSVVVQELRVEVECVHPALRLGSIKAGSYKVGMDDNGRCGFIEVGDLYAEEERDFLVSTDIPDNESDNEMPLVKFRVIHKDPIKNTFVNIEGNEVTILRPETVVNQTVSLEVQRQRNRLNVASAIADARVVAEHGDLMEARLVLEECKTKLEATSDDDCGYLEDELEDMGFCMVDEEMYESTGRANVLAGLSAHASQRATTWGDSRKLGSKMKTYQTPAMAKMVKSSKTFGN
ncbi:zinc finger (C3HC4-type RING finger) family protein [Artemisia annua]|uniref:Zinc finger (C3HC4-type RING finger) family protein n=1 Tax=Artemisia annua TaxID=35608 RepID=A0A2U1KZG5_ARTAN|nr:zinc finger (C3HC4-type RING finger) family protein [Artemisia annua]